MSRARTVCAPAGALRWYWPLSLVSTLRAVPTITTLAPASGVPDSAARTVPVTVPVCCAVSGVVRRTAASTGKTRFDPTGHLREDASLDGQTWVRNTPPWSRPLGRDAPGRIRTCDQQLRRLLLYPPELRARGKAGLKSTEADAQTRSGIVVNGGH